MAPYFASQRVILPELVGEDETRIAQSNSLIEGGTAFAGLAGPALAGVLIPFLGAPNVLYVDAGTYVVPLLLLALLVPRARRADAPVAQHGVLAGVKFLPGDRLLGPTAAPCACSTSSRPGFSASLELPAWGVMAVLFVAMLFTPLLNGPVIGVTTARTPPELRPKLTALISLSLRSG